VATPIFDFLTLRRSLVWTRWGIFIRYVSEIQEFNNFSKTGSLVEIFQREPNKLMILVKKSREKSSFFWAIFSTKLQYSSSLDLQHKSGEICWYENGIWPKIGKSDYDYTTQSQSRLKCTRINRNTRVTKYRISVDNSNMCREIFGIIKILKNYLFF
jgi:hypothetical protein